jgi:enoyl-CoA hydratase/carnithine racemase
MSNETSTVLYSIKNNIAFVTLNRPEKHNALTLDLFRTLIETAKRIKKDKSIRAVILSGSGDSFCSGLDFKAMSKMPSMVPKLFLKFPWRKDNDFQRVALIWRDIPVPVISVIKGNCFGGGLQIALGSDFRYAKADAKLSVMEMKWGLIPDMSLTATMTTLCAYDIAQELTMTARIFSGEEAKEYGLVTKICAEPMDDAIALAEVLVAQSPDAIAATKSLFNKTWKASERKALRLERGIQMKLLGRKNQRIALNNGLKKENKPFIDRSAF